MFDRILVLNGQLNSRPDFQVEFCSDCRLERQQAALSMQSSPELFSSISRHVLVKGKWLFSNGIKSFGSRGKHSIPTCFPERGRTTANLFNFVTKIALLCTAQLQHAADAIDVDHTSLKIATLIQLKQVFDCLQRDSRFQKGTLTQRVQIKAAKV